MSIVQRLTSNGWFTISDVAELRIIQDCFNKGEDLNAKAGNGNTALHITTVCRNVKSVDLLCKLGADVNAQNEAGKTALFYCPHNESGDKIQALLIANGADVNMQDSAGFTVLHHEIARLIKIVSWSDLDADFAKTWALEVGMLQQEEREFWEKDRLARRIPKASAPARLGRRL